MFNLRKVFNTWKTNNLQHTENIQPIKKNTEPFKNIQLQKIIQGFRAIVIGDIFAAFLDTFHGDN